MLQEYISTILRQDKKTRIVQRIISWTYYFLRNALAFANFEKESLIYILSINLVQILTQDLTDGYLADIKREREVSSAN